MNLMSHNSTYSIRIQIFIANNDEFTGPTLEPLSLSPDVLRCRWCFGAWSVVLLVGLLASGWSFRLVPQAGPSGWSFRLGHWLASLTGTLAEALAGTLAATLAGCPRSALS